MGTMKAKISHIDETLSKKENKPLTGALKTADDRKIYLVGCARAQGELLAGYIETHAGLNCDLIEDFETAVRSIQQNGTSVLLLRDCYHKNKDMILTELELVYQQKLSWALCCLFNLSKDSGVELEAVEYGVKGFVYTHEQLDHMLRCISGVFNGEIWLSRKRMSEYIKKRRTIKKNDRDHSFDSQLTRRETEILRMLASGNSNQAIGETLFISPHTVKTHVYNIYKKIDVSDRLQAALWATKHL